MLVLVIIFFLKLSLARNLIKNSSFYIKQGRILEGRVGDRHLLLMSRGTTPTLDITYFQKAPAGNYGMSQNLQKISGQPTDRIIYTPDGKYYNF